MATVFAIHSFLVVAGCPARTRRPRPNGPRLDNVVKDPVGAVELRPLARRQVAEGAEHVKGRTAAALLLGCVEGFVVEAVLHTHPRQRIGRRSWVNDASISHSH
jgi:hypothetical protein